MSRLGQIVHSAWLFCMRTQGREVSEERQSWETLPERDKHLDEHIAWEVVKGWHSTATPTNAQQAIALLKEVNLEFTSYQARQDNYEWKDEYSAAMYPIWKRVHEFLDSLGEQKASSEFLNSPLKRK